MMKNNIPIQFKGDPVGALRETIPNSEEVSNVDDTLH